MVRKIALYGNGTVKLPYKVLFTGNAFDAMRVVDIIINTSLNIADA